MIDKKTPFTEAEISALFREREIDEKYFKRFYHYYIECFTEIYEEESKNCNEEDSEEIGDYAHTYALTGTDRYIEIFLREKALNHGDEWAHAVTHYEEEEEESTYYFVYDDLNKSNPELAKKELLILCQSYNEDEYFEKHFKYLYEEGSGFNRGAERARNYSKIYKEQLSRGKSEVYSHEYARLLSNGDYNPIYCEEYAYAYDKAIKEGKSEAFALKFAEVYGDALVDVKSWYDISEDEEQINYAIEKVDVYMTVWEYNEKHKLTDFKRFADIYETIYFNSYYPNEEGPVGTKEEIDAKILEKALEQYNK